MKNIPELQEDLKHLLSEKPKLRVREQARELGISEAERLCLELGKKVTLLQWEFKEILKSLANLGEVMALTRNETCVHELYGIFKPLKVVEEKASVCNDKLDLTFALDRWGYALAVKAEKKSGPIYSFQFFDRYGNAAHKVYLMDKSKIDAYKTIKEKFTTSQQVPMLLEKGKGTFPEDKCYPLGAIKSFQADWLKARDFKEFNAVVKKYKVARLQALHHAPEGLALPIGIDNLEGILHRLIEQQIAVKITSSNSSARQSMSGHIHHLKRADNWLNILDNGFNLHIDTERLASAWLIELPQGNDNRAQIEIYDIDDNCVLSIGEAGKQERAHKELWKSLLNFINELQK